MVQPGSTAVQNYYDRHTSHFVILGEGGRLGAIHRAVWGPGVADRTGAYRYLEDRIADLIAGLGPSADSPHVVDLGCGVGGSLCYLATRLPIRGTGITLSPVQARRAADRLAATGLSDRVVCIRGDYLDLPPDLPPADLAFAIESFVHTTDPVRFFDECSRLVRPDVLVICDDFRKLAGESAAEDTIAEFCRGWQVNALLNVARLRALAHAAGFEHEQTLDLSPYLRLHRMRDRLIDVLLRLLPMAPAWLGPLRGGRALQTCLERGWVGYDFVVFRRRA
jgi:SAM-dependent methyltransferase